MAETIHIPRLYSSIGAVSVHNATLDWSKMGQVVMPCVKNGASTLINSNYIYIYIY